MTVIDLGVDVPITAIKTLEGRTGYYLVRDADDCSRIADLAVYDTQDGSTTLVADISPSYPNSDASVGNDIPDYRDGEQLLDDVYAVLRTSRESQMSHNVLVALGYTLEEVVSQDGRISLTARTPTSEHLLDLKGTLKKAGFFMPSVVEYPGEIYTCSEQADALEVNAVLVASEPWQRQHDSVFHLPGWLTLGRKSFRPLSTETKFTYQHPDLKRPTTDSRYIIANDRKAKLRDAIEQNVAIYLLQATDLAAQQEPDTIHLRTLLGRLLCNVGWADNLQPSDARKVDAAAAEMVKRFQFLAALAS